MNAFTKALAAVILLTSPLNAQGLLDEFSYEGLKLRGIGVEGGFITSDRLTDEAGIGFRVDYGNIAPKVRLLFGLSYFKGDFDRSEVRKFENRLRRIVFDPTRDFTIDAGTISWSDLEADVDLEYLIPAGSVFLPHVGVGLGVHVRNGSGAAIENTFVEDALDTVAAAFNGIVGTEVALSKSVHLTVDLRGTLSSELNALSLWSGFMYRLP